MQQSTGLASLAVLVAAALWGLYWIPVRSFEEQGISGAITVALLNAPGGIISAIWVAATWRHQRPHLGQALLIGPVAGLALALYGISILHTTVIRATMLFYLMPVWATLIGIYWLGEAAHWRRWVAIAMGLAGLPLLVGGAVTIGFNLGDAMAFLSGWVWAVATALMKRGGRIPIGGMLTMQFICVGAFALILGGLTGGIGWSEQNNQEAVRLAMAVSVFGVLPALAMIFWASQFLDPGRVGLLLMAEVVVAVISAGLLLPEESLTYLQWAAVALIVGAAFVELLPNRKATEEESRR